MGKGNSVCELAMMEPDQLKSGLAGLDLPVLYEVGGAVRDQLLGKQPADVDLVTCGVNAEELLEACRRIGEAEELIVAGQLVGVRLRASFTDPEGVEIALARTERSTGPGHTDFEICPVEPHADLIGLAPAERIGHQSLRVDLLQDLNRRDFTCNAIARYLFSGEIIDPLNGQSDLKAGLLQVISPNSFRDDPLRILRGLARISQDNLQPTQETVQQAESFSEQIANISPERIGAELLKIISGNNSACALSLARDWGALSVAIPELADSIGFDQQNRWHRLTVDQHTLAALNQADKMKLDQTTKLAVLFHDCGKPATAKPNKSGGLCYYRFSENDPLWTNDPQRALDHETVGAQLTEQALARMALGAQITSQVTELVKGHMFSAERDFRSRTLIKQQIRARKMLARYGHSQSVRLCQLRICDLAGKKGQLEDGFDKDALALIEMLSVQRSMPTSLKELSIDGSDLQRMGLPEGPAYKKVLQGLLKIVVSDPLQNDPQRLEKHALRAVKAL